MPVKKPSGSAKTKTAPSKQVKKSSDPGKAREEKGYNIFAILSLVFAFLISLLGLVFGIIALIQINKSGEKGRGLAIAGIIISALLMFSVLLFMILMFIAFFTIANAAYVL